MNPSPPYKYFVSYVIADDKSNQIATANVDIGRYEPITNIIDIRSIERSIEMNFNYYKVVITNWRRFEQPE